MNGFIKPLHSLLSHQVVERQIAPGVRLHVRTSRESLMHGVADRIHNAWASFRAPQQRINLQQYLDRAERRAA